MTTGSDSFTLPSSRLVTAPGRRTPRVDLALALLAALAIASFAGFCLKPTLGEVPLYSAAQILTSVFFVTVGVLLTSERTTRRLAWAFIGCGVLWAAQWLSTWQTGIWPVVGPEANAIFYSLGAWGVLNYPASLPRPRPERLFVVCLTAYLVASPIVLIAVSKPEWLDYDPDIWWPSVVQDRELFDRSMTFLSLLGAIAGIAFAYRLWRRFRNTKGIDSVISRPIAIGFAAAGLLSGVGQPQVFPTAEVTFYYFYVGLAVSSAPAGMLIALVRRRLQHAAVADAIHYQFAREAATSETVRDALRHSLRDSNLEVFYWEPVSGYVDEQGLPVVVADISDRLVREVTTSSGQPLAAIVADISLGAHRAVVDTALNASGMALENARLQASVRFQLEEVRRSRARIAEAALNERHRIERDLHDGVQQRLLAIVTRLGVARHKTDDKEASRSFGAACDELRSTLEALRDLARGISPPELRQFGLKSALEVMAEGMPLEVDLDVLEERTSATSEATAYFVVSEAVANIVKHSEATSAEIRVWRDDGELQIKVSDNGVGGAGLADGTGLMGLVDRVNALGGDMFVENGEKGGTVLRANFPCE